MFIWLLLALTASSDEEDDNDTAVAGRRRRRSGSANVIEGRGPRRTSTSADQQSQGLSRSLRSNSVSLMEAEATAPVPVPTSAMTSAPVLERPRGASFLSSVDASGGWASAASDDAAASPRTRVGRGVLQRLGQERSWGCALCHIPPNLDLVQRACRGG